MKTSNNPYDDYEKFASFVSEEGFRAFKQWAKDQRIPLVKAQGKACEVLHPRVRAGFVAPKVWNRDCGRQGSWYRDSTEAGKHLIVASVPLESMNGGTKLTLSDFSPPVLPTGADIDKLVNTAEYQTKRPDEWERTTEEDRLKYRNLLSQIERLKIIRTKDPDEYTKKFSDLLGEIADIVRDKD